MNWFQRQKLRTIIQENPYHRLYSPLDIAVAVELGIKIDVNRASVDEWLRLSTISIHQARNLVELSSMGVQFLCLEDIAAALNISCTQIQLFEPLLYFAYYEPTISNVPQRFNINQASVSDLESVYCIDNALACAIVENRHKQGLYKSLANLQNRLKIEGHLMSQLIHYLHC